jgi:heparosan-N-sulfate-glucuronate 5-epimerase
MVRLVGQEPQLRGRFRAGELCSGYYSDLRAKAGKSPSEALERFRHLSTDRTRANPIYIAQLGLGAWQHLGTSTEWEDVARRCGEWILANMDDDGRLAYLTPARHTYVLEPPWYSAMAQGEAASLLVRLNAGDPAFLAGASRAVRSLLDATDRLVVFTPEGPVLQEYPTQPPAHVLNGWIMALWGLYDVAQAGSAGAAAAGAAFDEGVNALAARLPLYRIAGGWSRYDLYPHTLVNVASPFYHRLHIEQLLAMQELAPRDVFVQLTAAWSQGLRRPQARAAAVARKIAFRLTRPRGRLRAAYRSSSSRRRRTGSRI